MSELRADTITSATDNTDLEIQARGTGVPNLESGFKVNGTVGVPVSALQTGTDGELITWDASGNPTTVAVGTAGQVLTSGGAGVAPTMQDAPGGSLVWLAGTTVSVAAASVNFPQVFFDNNTDYDHFLVEIQDLSPATDSVRAWMRVTSNNGSTYEATAYSQNSLRVNSGSVAGFQTGTSAAQIVISDNSEVIGSNATKAYGGTLKFRNPLSTTNYKHFQIDGQAHGSNAGSAYAMRTAGSGMWASAAPATGFQVLFSSGNVDGGIINVYGMKNS